jgi:epoxide hydrolase 4
MLGCLACGYTTSRRGAGPLVILLHGFPEFWYSWRNQIPALASAGYRAVAPDMRGYNLSDKPKGVRPYQLQHLTGDVAALIHHLGEERAIIGGHDWGGAVAWSFAAAYPALLDRLLIFNVPHPERMKRGLRTLRQLIKSSYMGAFQAPFFPELAFRALDFRAFRETLRRDPVQPGAFTDSDIDRYVEALRRPYALTAGINYYRASARNPASLFATVARPVDRPVQVIWGEQDRYLGRELAVPNPRWVPNARVTFIPDASHWVQNDCPERVNELILRFLSE